MTEAYSKLLPAHKYFENVVDAKSGKNELFIYLGSSIWCTEIIYHNLALIMNEINQQSVYPLHSLP